MRKYPNALFLRGIGFHLLHAWYLWLPCVVCVILGIIRWTALYSVAAGFFSVWIVNAVTQERAAAREYEKEDADPEYVAAVEREFKNRFEPKD